MFPFGGDGNMKGRSLLSGNCCWDGAVQQMERDPWTDRVACGRRSLILGPAACDEEQVGPAQNAPAINIGASPEKEKGPASGRIDDGEAEVPVGLGRLMTLSTTRCGLCSPPPELGRPVWAETGHLDPA